MTLKPSLKTADLTDAISAAPRIRGKVVMLNVPPEGHLEEDTSVLPPDEKWNTINKIEFLKLPSSLRASSSNEVRTVIFLRWNEDVVGKYTGGSTARKVACEVVVIDLATRTIVAKA